MPETGLGDQDARRETGRASWACNGRPDRPGLPFPYAESRCGPTRENQGQSRFLRV